MSTFDGSLTTFSSGVQDKWVQFSKNVSKWSYVLVSLILIFVVSYYFYTVLQRPAAGTLWFVGASILFFYYYVKWFVVQRPLDPNLQPGNQSCPDYLSMVPPGILYTPVSPTQYRCIDYVGVSRNGRLKKADPAKIKQQINNPDYYFAIDPTQDFITPSAKSAFLERLIAYGLSYNSAGDGSLPTQASLPNL
jgi:hypothetical protein